MVLSMFNRFTTSAKLTLKNFNDPIIGKKIIELQRPTFLIRADGRSLTELKKLDGFQPRVHPNRIENARHSCIQRYQQYNEDPFAYGACQSIKDLTVFISENSSHVNNAWIHKFYGLSTSLGYLKVETGIEIEAHDRENEEIFIEHIPFKQFIASTSPEYRQKFLDNKLVPNAMKAFRDELPKEMKMEDLFTEETVLLWLLRNDCEVVFSEICEALYANAPKNELQFRLNNNVSLIDTVMGHIQSLGNNRSLLAP